MDETMPLGKSIPNFFCKLNFQDALASHYAMRQLFLILMIALLPLRGWVSDAMATEMVTAQVQQQQTATKIADSYAYEVDAQAHHDVEIVNAETVQTAAECTSHAFGEDEHAEDTHCNTCSACQACHTVALSPPTVDVTPTFNPRTLPRAVVAQFVSAEHALGQKPPIS